MKKAVVFVLICIFLTSFVLAEDVGYILKSRRAVDSRITGVFSEMNLSYKLIEDKNVPKENLASFKFLFIDDAILRNTAKVKIWNFPSVIMNQNYGYDWGLTDKDGISQLASTSPLNVKLPDNGIKQVYTQAKYSIGGISIPYFYLDDLNKAEPSVSIARTYTGGVHEFGDVISVIPKGARLNGNIITKGKLCFYGIAKTEYWTSQARELFKDCVGSVLSKCSHDIECGIDGAIGNKYCMNNSVYQNYIDFTCNLPDTRNSYCSNLSQQRLIETCLYGCSNGVCKQAQHDTGFETNYDGLGNTIRIRNLLNNNVPDPVFINQEGYDIHFKIVNRGNFQENITLNCTISNKTATYYDWSRIKRININDSYTDGGKDNFDFPFGNGEYNITCIINPTDANPIDNFATRKIIINKSLPQCTQDSDCGSTSYGNNYCIGKNVSRQVTTPVCTTFGICSSIITIETLETCSDLCANGACVNITCRVNSDCNDFNDRTQDTCVNPGTTASFCRNTPINCLNDNDCGFTGHIGDGFCNQNDVFKNYQEARCNNAGTLNSSCSIRINPRLIIECDDSDSRTVDSCVEPPARCVHILPVCFLNSDCTGKTSNSFCSGDEFWINITKPICLNPGRADAQCSLLSKSLFFEDCQYGCSSGRCNPS